MTSNTFGVLLRWLPVSVVGAGLWAKLLFAAHTFDFGSGTTIVIAGLATTAWLLAPLCLLKGRPRVAGLAIVSFAVALLLLADLVFFRRFRDVPTIADLSGARQLLIPEVAGSALALVEPRDGWLFLDVVVVLCFLAWGRRGMPVEPAKTRRRTAAVVALLGCVSSIPAARVFAGALPRANGDLFRGELVGRIGILPYHLFDCISHVLPGRPRIDGSPAEYVRRFLSAHASDSPGPLTGIAAGRNVILIQAESLMSFPIGLVVNGQPVAPNLAAFAAESLDFQRFFDQTYSGGTEDGEFTALNSLHPLTASAIPFRHPRNHFRALPRILSDAGYATLSAMGASGGTYRMHLMHPAYGFQTSFFEPDFDARERFYWVTDHQFFKQMIPRLRAQKPPFMAFLISSSNHAPYSDAGKESMLRLPANLAGTDLGDYLRSVNYFDGVFGEFIRGLRESGLLESSLVALYGDHSGIWDRTAELPELLGFDPENEVNQRLALSRLPFIVRLPGGGSAAQLKTPGGHLDIAPTLLDLLGAGRSERVMLGRSLIGAREAVVAFRDGSALDGVNWYVNRPFSGDVACYDMRTTRAIDCHQVESLRAAARQRLLVSDTILRNDLIDSLVTTPSARLLSDLPRPAPFSAAANLGNVQIFDNDVFATAPSGATFTIGPGGRPVWISLTPGIVKGPPQGASSDGVTFEVWSNGQRVFQRHVMPDEDRDPIAVQLPPMQESAPAAFSLVTTPGPRGDSAFDWSVWRNVFVFTAGPSAKQAPENLPSRSSPLRLFDLPMPVDFSHTLAAGATRIVGADLEADAPAGATFEACGGGSELQLTFSPAWVPGRTISSERPIYQVWSGAKRLLNEATDMAAAARIAVTIPPVTGRFNFSLVNPEDPTARRAQTGIRWKDVRLVGAVRCR